MKYLSIDVGGTSLKYAVIDDRFIFGQQGKLLSEKVTNHEEMLKAIQNIYGECGRPEGGIAISYCGELNSKTGHLYNGGSYRFMENTNLKADVEKAVGTVVSVENDGNCAAIAEVERGSLVDVKDAFVAVIGTGIAGSLVLDRKIRRGAHGFSGFLTMTVKHIDMDFSVDNLAVTAVSAKYLGKGYEHAMNLEKKTIDGIAFFDLANKGDETALDILRTYCRNLANMLHNVHLAVDVEAVAVGGGISTQPLFQKMLEEAFDRLYDATPLKHLHIPKPKLFVCKYYNDANLIGALCHHISNIKN